MKPARTTEPPRWLLLIHQIPPTPGYFRAKVARRLQRVGAVAIKNSVYVLPSKEQTQEDLQWVAREIVAEGGDATLCEANLVEGLRDEQVEALFHAAREADYAALAEEARQTAAEMPVRLARDSERRAELEALLARGKKRLNEILAIDFFGAPGRETAAATLRSLETRLQADSRTKSEPAARPKSASYRGRVWVTRQNVHVDRIGSAWLIKRFIDPKASFKFVASHGYRKQKRDVTFDMFDADFTHIGDRCTFEVLISTFGLRAPGLAALAEIVHDIDVKDGKFGRPESAGVASVVAGVALAQPKDERRVELGSELFDALLEFFRRKR